MSILSAIILGLVQGIAEFLPISSSGHLSILQNFLHMTTTEDSNLFFDVLLHLGTLVAVCVVYWKDIVAIVRDTVDCFKGAGHPEPGGKKLYPGARLLLMIILATLPLFLVLPFKDRIEQLYYNTFFIGGAFIVTGLILYFSDRMKNGRKNEKNMTVGSALIIGVCQAIATVPGISRSGASISGGMATGLDREFAAKFSFLISVPAVLGANILSLADALKAGIDTSLLPAYLIGMVVAMVSGYFAINLVKVICRKGKFGKFAYYCWAIGIVTLVLSFVL